jgi:hypothetical protein
MDAYIIGRFIIWIPIFALAGWLLVSLWRLTSAIQRKYLRLTIKVILGLLTAVIVIFLGIVFFLTCYGIGAAGCM